MNTVIASDLVYAQRAYGIYARTVSNRLNESIAASEMTSTASDGREERLLLTDLWIRRVAERRWEYRSCNEHRADGPCSRMTFIRGITTRPGYILDNSR